MRWCTFICQPVKDACGVCTVVGVGSDDGAATIVEVVVKSGKPAEDPGRFARHRGGRASHGVRLLTNPKPAGDHHQLFCQHRVGQPVGQAVRREQRGRGADVIAKRADTVARAISAADDLFEAIDGFGDERAMRLEMRGVEAGADRSRRVFDADRCPGIAQPVNALDDGSIHPLVVSQRAGVNEELEPYSAHDGGRHLGQVAAICRRLIVQRDERERERTAHQLGDVVAASGLVQAEQEEVCMRMEGFAAREGGDDGLLDDGDVGMHARGSDSKLGTRGPVLVTRHYNYWMPVVRYVVLAALVVWLGAIGQALAGEAVRYHVMIAYACGAVMVLGLVVMKFVGPPPDAFAPRLALVALMLAVSGAATIRGQSRVTLGVTAGLGAVLLGWYARE